MSVLVADEGNRFRTLKIFHGAQSTSNESYFIGDSVFLTAKDLLNGTLRPTALCGTKMIRATDTTARPGCLETVEVIP
ncbi:hypothetical protein DMJ13_26765 [halophilic archaeon]|nr:hypothetical protein DMJ13_26765 [halophilic archaeon]